jgi:hypothetical protein
LKGLWMCLLTPWYSDIACNDAPVFIYLLKPFMKTPIYLCICILLLALTACKSQKRKKPNRLVGGCCFSRGTKICLNDGSVKNIESIKPGDLILSVSSDGFTLRRDSVTLIDSVQHRHLVQLELEDGTLIKSTGDHPYYIDGKGWCSADTQNTYANYGIPAQELKAGDYCLRYAQGDLKRVLIRSISPCKGTEMTYNLSGLAHGNSYLANGILVSNENAAGRLTRP